MLFNSYQFIFVFLTVALIGYFMLAKYRYTKLATTFLVIMSLAFYAQWNISYLPLLLLSILFNYLMGAWIEKTRRRSALIFGIGMNLTLLGYYKYIGFFGLFKKVVIADTLAPWVKLAFDHADQLTFIEAWLGAVGYTLQLYFNFSGYSEMALGLGLMINFKLPINFDSPYKSTSIIEFWRRWHMTLSEFLKNYLYVPLGGNRQGDYVKMRNLMITMLLGGL